MPVVEGVFLGAAAVGLGVAGGAAVYYSCRYIKRNIKEYRAERRIKKLQEKWDEFYKLNALGQAPRNAPFPQQPYPVYSPAWPHHHGWPYQPAPQAFTPVAQRSPADRDVYTGKTHGLSDEQKTAMRADAVSKYGANVQCIFYDPADPASVFEAMTYFDKVTHADSKKRFLSEVIQELPKSREDGSQIMSVDEATAITKEILKHRHELHDADKAMLWQAADKFPSMKRVLEQADIQRAAFVPQKREEPAPVVGHETQTPRPLPAVPGQIPPRTVPAPVPAPAGFERQPGPAPADAAKGKPGPSFSVPRIPPPTMPPPPKKISNSSGRSPSQEFEMNEDDEAALEALRQFEQEEAEMASSSPSSGTRPHGKAPERVSQHGR